MKTCSSCSQGQTIVVIQLHAWSGPPTSYRLCAHLQQSRSPCSCCKSSSDTCRSIQPPPDPLVTLHAFHGHCRCTFRSHGAQAQSYARGNLCKVLVQWQLRKASLHLLITGTCSLLCEQSALPLVSVWVCGMRSGSNSKVLAERALKYSRIS